MSSAGRQDAALWGLFSAAAGNAPAKCPYDPQLVASLKEEVCANRRPGGRRGGLPKRGRQLHGLSCHFQPRGKDRARPRHDRHGPAGGYRDRVGLVAEQAGEGGLHGDARRDARRAGDARLRGEMNAIARLGGDSARAALNKLAGAASRHTGVVVGAMTKLDLPAAATRAAVLLVGDARRRSAGTIESIPRAEEWSRSMGS